MQVTGQGHRKESHRTGSSAIAGGLVESTSSRIKLNGSFTFPCALETAWRNAFCAWWEAATAGDWDAEHALRMAAADAWHDLPDQVKVGAWVRWKLSRGEVPEPGTYEVFARGLTERS